MNAASPGRQVRQESAGATSVACSVKSTGSSSLACTPQRWWRCLQAKGYAARSAYKLLELQQRYNVLPAGAQSTVNAGSRPGYTQCIIMTAHAAGASQHGAVRVLDLGCAPGAWLQMACTILGKKHAPGSLVLGLDLQVQPVGMCWQNRSSSMACAASQVMQLTVLLGASSAVSASPWH